VAPTKQNKKTHVNKISLIQQHSPKFFQCHGLTLISGAKINQRKHPPKNTEWFTVQTQKAVRIKSIKMHTFITWSVVNRFKNGIQKSASSFINI